MARGRYEIYADGKFLIVSPGSACPRDQYLAILRMLVRRATILDRWRAARKKGHWLNWARHEIAIS